MSTSAIRKELEAAAATVKDWKPQARGEADPEFLARLQAAIAKQILDPVWEGLSEAAQDWNNAAADALIAKGPIPPFPDEPAEPAATSRRSRAAAPPPPPPPEVFVPKIGDRVVITTKRGVVKEGVIVEMDADTYVLNAEGEEGAKENDVEVSVATVAALALSNTAEAAAAGQAQPVNPNDPKEPLVPQVGDTIQVVTARGRTIMGIVKELDGDELLLVDAKGEPHELFISKLTSSEVKVQANPKGAVTVVPPATRARGGATAGAGAAAGSAAAESQKQPRSSNEGVSIGARVREILTEDPTMTLEQTIAKMNKEGLKFRETSIKMIHKDTMHTIGLMQKAGKGRK